VFTDEVPDAAVLVRFGPCRKRAADLDARRLKSTKDSDEKSMMPCTQMVEILVANRGRGAKIELADRSLYSRVIPRGARGRRGGRRAGPIGAARSLGPLAAAKPRWRSSKSREPAHAPQSPPLSTRSRPINGSYFVMRTEEGGILLSVGQVRSIQVKDMKTTSPDAHHVQENETLELQV